MGDDLGFIHMYNMTDLNWHYCFYKDYSKMEVKDPKFEKKPEQIRALGAKIAASHQKGNRMSTPTKGQSEDGELSYTPNK